MRQQYLVGHTPRNVPRVTLIEATTMQDAVDEVARIYKNTPSHTIEWAVAPPTEDGFSAIPRTVEWVPPSEGRWQISMAGLL